MKSDRFIGYDGNSVGQENGREERSRAFKNCAGGDLDDSVVVDAKRILLRYGAPIALLDEIDDPTRVRLAREVSRTAVADRGDRLRDLLVIEGFMDQATADAQRSRKSRKKKAPPQA
jgi:hypothetical protein